MKIGVLAVQGAFIEHISMLSLLSNQINEEIECVELRQKSDLEGIDGLILPGGESTVQGQLLKKLDMFDTLKNKIENGLPVLATCAGLILLSGNLENDSVRPLATLPVTTRRNAYGRQLGSFKVDANIGEIKDYPMVFIRAPYITEVSEEVKPLATVDGNIVAAECGNQIALAFHPEMTEDTRIHNYFIDIVRQNKSVMA